MQHLKVKLYTFKGLLRHPLSLFLLCLSSLIVSHVFTFEVSTSADDVHFFLYTSRRDLGYREELSYGGCNCGSGEATTSPGTNSFKKGLVTVFMLHDFAEDGDSYGIQMLKNAYLKSGIEGNFIIVDWGLLSVPRGSGNTTDYKSDYQKVVNNVPIVGERLSFFIKNMVQRNQVTSRRIHLLGHGLGAHVAGYAGNTYISYNLGLLSRITGLDPSAPLFNIEKPARKLRKHDAIFVDIIVTNGGFQGDARVDGDAKFFPNGGFRQPDCDDVSTLGMCSHSYSIQLYIAGFRKPFVSCLCPILADDRTINNCYAACPGRTYPGPFCPSRSHGDYYLEAPNPLMIDNTN